jgi:hypothetical protein
MLGSQIVKVGGDWIWFRMVSKDVLELLFLISRNGHTNKQRDVDVFPYNLQENINDRI